MFVSKCYIKRNEYNLGKFDSRIDEGIFLGYSPDSKACKCFNTRPSKVLTSADVTVDDESLASTSTTIKEEDDGPEMEQTHVSQNEENIRNPTRTTSTKASNMKGDKNYSAEL